MKPWKTFRASILRLCSVAMLAFGVLCVIPARASAEIGVSFGVFYDSLAPYGEWLYVGHYGRVWRPRASVVGIDFRPYATGGHWLYTDYGWSFESDYEWGWAPFHYGRWLPDQEYGWVWVPDTAWAPAWVDWRYGDGYIGWAPLTPVGAPIVIDHYYSAWCFVPTRHFLERDFYHHAVPLDRVYVHFGTTVPIHNEVAYGGARWYAGPPAGHVAAAVGQPIRPVAVVPPSPGTVQPVHAGVPTVVSAPVGRSVGTPATPGAPPSARVAVPSWSHSAVPGVGRPSVTQGAPATAPNIAHLPAPNWPAGRAVNLPGPVAGTPTQAPASVPTPRLQPGWGAQPAPSQVSPPVGHPAPQGAAPQFHPTAPAPSARFVAPAPQPRSTFVQPMPTARPAPQMPMAGRSVAAPQAPSFQQQPAATFRAPTPAPVVAPRPAPIAMAPVRTAPAPIARGTPVGRTQVP